MHGKSGYCCIYGISHGKRISKPVKADWRREALFFSRSGWTVLDHHYVMIHSIEDGSRSQHTGDIGYLSGQPCWSCSARAIGSELGSLLAERLHTIATGTCYYSIPQSTTKSPQGKPRKLAPVIPNMIKPNMNLLVGISMPMPSFPHQSAQCDCVTLVFAVLPSGYRPRFIHHPMHMSPLSSVSMLLSFSQPKAEPISP